MPLRRPPFVDAFPVNSVTYSVGDKLRHRQRPEWGIGSVTKIELVTRQGQRDQRIWIRFPNAGLKTVLGSVADLEGPLGQESGPPPALPTPRRSATPGNAMPAASFADAAETLVAREATHESGWLGAITKRRPDEAMTTLPSTATDPFLSLGRRLEFVLSLFRFESSGGKLIDWAVAQSGLDDPLSRFNRHELEAFFQRWAFERDATVARLVIEARRSGTDIAGKGIEEILRLAPPAAQRALRKLIAAR